MYLKFAGFVTFVIVCAESFVSKIRFISKIKPKRQWKSGVEMHEMNSNQHETTVWMINYNHQITKILRFCRALKITTGDLE